MGEMGRQRWRRRSALIVCASVALTHTALSQITNNWIAPASGKWETATNWDQGPPSSAQSAVFITNAVTKTVMIDSITASNFPGTLIISNLTVDAPAGNTNTLFLAEISPATPLHILDGLTVADRGLVIATNATLLVDGQLQGKGLMVFGQGGFLIATNSSLVIAPANAASGRLTVSNGTVQAQDVVAGSGDSNNGAIEVIGGTLTMNGSLVVSAGLESQASLLVDGGGLVVVSNAASYVADGEYCGGSVVVSNGTILADDLWVGSGFRSFGSFAIDAGTVALNGALRIGGGASSAGMVLMNGGVLSVTQADTYIPAETLGVGEMTISNGLFVARNLFVATANSLTGTLTVDGGVVHIRSDVQIGNGTQSIARVLIEGGEVVVTNGAIRMGSDSFNTAQMTVSGGRLAANRIEIGTLSPINGAGTLTIAGGTTTVSTGIVLGDCPSSSAGYAIVTGGELNVTNDEMTAFIDVRGGQLVLSNGILQVDTLVMTNRCGLFVRGGGTLIAGSVVLDPNYDADGDGIPNGYEQAHGLDPLNAADASHDSDGDGMSNLQEYLAGTDPTNSASVFRILEVAPEGNDVRITWMTGPNKTNALQMMTGSAGNFTNAFTDLFIATNTVGTVTNYLDAGALSATNTLRLYRVRLVP
jgi:hypothetical protein